MDSQAAWVRLDIMCTVFGHAYMCTCTQRRKAQAQALTVHVLGDTHTHMHAPHAGDNLHPAPRLSLLPLRRGLSPRGMCTCIPFLFCRK